MRPRSFASHCRARNCFLRSVLLPAVLFAPPAFQAQDLASLVNPFVGTQISSLHDSGNTAPGAVRPFGMLDWSPDTPGESFYRWEKPLTRGFSLTHTSGAGCAQFGDAPVFPLEGLPPPPADQARQPLVAHFRHEDEIAQPGYYSVRLDTGIGVALAAQIHSGIAEFRFPEDGKPHTLLFDLGHNLAPRIFASEIHIRGRTITGSVTSGDNCASSLNRYRVYFVFETDRTPRAVEASAASAAGVQQEGYVSFPPAATLVRLKAGISFVSIANAEKNLKREIPGWDLQLVRRQARAAWNLALRHIVVRGGGEKDQRTLYTALYHALLHPSVFSDVDGEYIGFDGRVHLAGAHPQYAGFSGWDIYRSEIPLLAMLFPDQGADMGQSLVRDAEQGGGLPVWPVANDDAHAMVGDPSDGILAGLYNFGARTFDARSALKTMMRGADDPRVIVGHVRERPFLEEYLRQGYVADRNIPGNGAASVTLEYQNADFAISRLAAALGDRKNESRFLECSARWRTLFDPETRYIRARGVDGRFLPGFSPTSEAGFVEGNAAQYTWMVPYDLEHVIEAVGGPTVARARLDEYFSHYYLWDEKNGPYFAIGNEPSFGNPWIYNWAGYPWRTQEVVRRTLRDLFAPDPSGLPGNDDLGATSSWCIFALLGLYPEIPGVGGLTLHSPVFPNVTLRFGNHAVQVLAAGAPSQLYVRSVSVDGFPVKNWWIDWNRLATASRVQFTLAGSPEGEPVLPPPSFFPLGR
jgi:predicted alpha-1,2-mannosidase